MNDTPHRPSRAPFLGAAITRIDLQLPYLVPVLIGSLSFSRVVTEVVTVAFCLYFLLRSALLGDWSWLRMPPVAVGISAWLFLSLVVAPASADTAVVFEKQVIWLRFPILFAGIVHLVLTDRERIEKALWPLLPIFAFIVCDLVFQYVTGASINGMEIQGDRLTSILNRPTAGWYLGKGYFAALALVSAVSLGQLGKVTRQAAAFFVLAPLALAVIPLTGDRSAMLLVALGAFFSILVLLASARRHRLLIVSGLLLALAAYALFLSQQTVVQNRTGLLGQQLSHFADSHYGQIFQGAWMIFQDNWLTGVGVKSFGELCGELVKSGQLRICSVHPHNPYLDWMVVAGLPGLVFWCSLAVILSLPGFKLLARRRTRSTACFGLSCLLLTFLPLQVSQSLFSNWPGLLTWTSLAMTYAAFRLFSGEKAQ